MSRFSAAGLRAVVSFPRVSGDEPLEDLSGAESAMFSPRERG